jgi:hypothetical protein
VRLLAPAGRVEVSARGVPVSLDEVRHAGAVALAKKGHILVARRLLGGCAGPIPDRVRLEIKCAEVSAELAAERARRTH